MLMSKILNIKTILAANILIFAIVEASGSYFMDSGYIHAIALAYIVLAFIALAQRPLEDVFLKRFLSIAPSAALLLFAGSHSIEFVRMKFGFLVLPTDTTIVNILNLHIAGLLAIVSAAWFVLNAYARRGPRYLPWLLAAVAGGAIVLTLGLLATGANVSLDPHSPILYGYLLGLVAVLAVGFVALWKLRKILPILKIFVDYFFIAFLFIAFAVLTVLFHSALQSMLGLPDYQILYISHFALYLSLSFLFLTSTRLSSMSPLYKEAEEFMAAETV